VYRHPSVTHPNKLTDYAKAAATGMDWLQQQSSLIIVAQPFQNVLDCWHKAVL
jgi:DICT domain-containing protein